MPNETQMINQILWSAFLFLSGATLPFPWLPGWIQRIALFLPATYLVTGLERVLVGRVGALDTWVGYNPQLENEILPQVENLAAEAERLLNY